MSLTRSGRAGALGGVREEGSQGAGRPSRASLRSARIARIVTTVGMTNRRKFKGPLKRPSSSSTPRDNSDVSWIVTRLPVVAALVRSAERTRADRDASEQQGAQNRDQAGHDEAQVPGLIGLVGSQVLDVAPMLNRSDDHDERPEAGETSPTFRGAFGRRTGTVLCSSITCRNL